MFTGIIEQLGKVTNIVKEGSNVHLSIHSPITKELKIDQSLSHNGVCLTVVDIKDDVHTVTAIDETMKKTNLGDLQIGDDVNLERAMISNGRLDGHIVQGHVDLKGHCTSVEEVDGSWYYQFKYPANPDYLLVNKGSICVNGVSLTVVDPTDDTFSVAIIPYTYEYTTFKDIEVGTAVNLEFDILGKYMARYMRPYLERLGV
ncbi:MAG: riboflavin synthase [Bacteroidota bacterium]